MESAYRSCLRLFEEFEELFFFHNMTISIDVSSCHRALFSIGRFWLTQQDVMHNSFAYVKKISTSFFIATLIVGPEELSMPFCLSAQTANSNAGLLPLTFFIGRLVLGVISTPKEGKKV
jgi:hypothetical protein